MVGRKIDASRDLDPIEQIHEWVPVAPKVWETLI